MSRRDRNRQRLRLLACGIGAALLAGCAAAPPEPSPSAADAPPAAAAVFDLGAALELSARQQLDVETVESLRLIAVEHVDNTMLLRLPGIAEEFRAGADYSADRLPELLDGAIAYNHILSAPPGSDLVEERRPRVAQLLAFAGAANWSKLAAVREKIALSGGIGTPELRQEEADLLLELRIATGLDTEALEQFSFGSLAEPRLLVFDLAGLQRYAARNRSESTLSGFPAELPGKVRAGIGSERAEIPLLAELLYRLPRRLAEVQLASPNRDCRELAALGSAVGIAFEIELSLNRLRKAWDEFEQAKRKSELTPDAVELKVKLAGTRKEWRLAYYRLLTDLGCSDLTVPFAANGGSGGDELSPEKSRELLRLLLPE